MINGQSNNILFKNKQEIKIKTQIPEEPIKQTNTKNQFSRKKHKPDINKKPWNEKDNRK